MPAVTCPTCYQTFEVAAPPPVETPCEVDYDCEVCCRPMLITFSADEEGHVGAEAGPA